MNRGKKARRGVSLLLALLMLLTVARAEKLEFPEGLKRIEAEAFMGDKAITSVVLPDSLTAVEARAFANCAKLKAIKIPAGVTSLGEGFLDGCPADVLIKTTAGSAAMRYAQTHQFDYQAGTKYRALLVGQTYKGSPYFGFYEWLDGPANDIKAMAKGLKAFSGTPYSVTSKSNLTAEGIADAIWTTFAEATEEDVSLFYYSGHGSNFGDLIGYDAWTVSPWELRRVLDQIPGRKIVIIDACYSGLMIAPEGIAEEGAGDGSAGNFVDSFMAAFSARTRDNLRGEEYFVITAASDSEYSWEINGRGVFTESFLKGCGYDCASGRNTSLYADSNGNGVVTLQEAYAYACKTALSRVSQHAQVYPSGCNWFGIFRK